MRSDRWFGSGVLAVGLLVSWPGAASGLQEAPKNLQYFPADMSRAEVVEEMRQFSFALGVRCQYCHVGGDGVSLRGVVWESDEDEDKRKARFMLRLVDTLNDGLLPMMESRDEPSSRITCKTCHRGLPKPALLTDVLRTALEQHGADSARARYRDLRENAVLSGSYDFGQWEMNTLGEELTAEGRYREAIAMYELNLEHYPRSVAILLALGQLHEQVGELDAARARYRQVLDVAPDNAAAAARLEAIGGGREEADGGGDQAGSETPSWENLQVLPQDIPRSELNRIMLANLSGLGLRRRANEGCLFCHVGSMDVPANEWDWASDEKPMKVKARAMMGMVKEINRTHLAGIERTWDEEVGCRTCHAGRTNPMPLADVLLRQYETGGVDALTTTYRELRAQYFAADAYDFRPHVLSGVAWSIAEGGPMEDAAAVHGLNIEATGAPSAAQGLIQLRMVQALDAAGPEAMMARYRELEAEQPAEAYTPSLLNGLGWKLFRSGRQEAAFRLFEENHALYPDAYSTTEDLAWANEILGNHERAVELARAWLRRHPAHELGQRLVSDLTGR